MRLAKCTKYNTGAFLQEAILCRREKPRAQHGAQRPVAEEQPALPELLIELPLCLTGEVVGEQLVILVDAVLQHEMQIPRLRWE